MPTSVRVPFFQLLVTTKEVTWLHHLRIKSKFLKTFHNNCINHEGVSLPLGGGLNLREAKDMDPEGPAVRF